MPIPAILAGLEGIIASSATRAATSSVGKAAAGSASREGVVSAIIESQIDAKRAGNKYINDAEIAKLKKFSSDAIGGGGGGVSEGGGGGGGVSEGGGGGGGILGNVAKGLDAFDQKLAKVANAAQEVANITVSAANNQFIPMLKQILPENMGKLVDAVTRVITAFVERGRELAGLSAELSYANAIVGVRGTMADMREAQELGGGISRMTLASDQIWHAIRDIILPIKKVVVDQMGEALQTVADATSFLANGGFAEVIEAIAKVTGTLLEVGRRLNPVFQALGVLGDIEKNTRKDDSPLKELEGIINKAKKLQFEDEGFRAKKAKPQLPMNIGLFRDL